MKIPKILVAFGVGAAVLAILPSLKGPFNRIRNTANEKLDAEFVIDNYKAEYMKLHAKHARLEQQIRTYRIELTVLERKLTAAKEELEAAKENLIKTGTSDMKAFMRAKDVYEKCLTKVNLLESRIKFYREAIAKLEKSYDLVVANMSKAKTNIDILTAKKEMLDSVKSVNDVIENLGGVGDEVTAINIEKIDDDLMHESIKLEALGADMPAKSMTEAEAQDYISKIK